MAPPRMKFFNSVQLSVIMRQIAAFQKEVEKDVSKFNKGTLIRFQNELIAIGKTEFTAMAKAVIDSVDMSDQMRDLMLSLRDRYIGIWTQHLAKTFATAEDSLEGKGTRLNRGRSIIRRIIDALLGAFQDDSEFGYYIEEKTGKIFSIKKLTNTSAVTVEAPVKISSLLHNLDAKKWNWLETPETTKVTRISPNEVLRRIKADTYPEHDPFDNRKRLETADLNYPIVVDKMDDSGRFNVLDGLHRLTKAYLQGRKTINVRVLKGGLPQSAVLKLPPSEKEVRPQMSGIVRVATSERTTRGAVTKRQRIFRTGLAKHIKLLVRTVPRNFFREADSLLLKATSRERRIPRDERLFLVSANAGPTICEACQIVNGRVLTADALMFIQRDVSPNLFHPNCKHYLVRSFTETTTTYKGKHGPIMTLKDVRAAARKRIGRGLRFRTRPNPHVIHV